jgi:hypothetical protein
MNTIRIVAAILLFSVATAAAAAPTVRLVPNEVSVEVIWDNGTPYVASDVINDDGSGTRVIISPTDQDYVRNQRISFSLAVYNYTDVQFAVGPEDVSATNGKNEALEIVSATERQSEIRSDVEKERDTQAVAIAIGLAYGHAGIPTGLTGDRSSTVPLDLQRAVLRIEEQLELAQLYFKEMTLLPKERAYGFLDIYPPNKRARDDTVSLTIVVGEHTHRVIFDYERLE